MIKANSDGGLYGYAGMRIHSTPQIGMTFLDIRSGFIKLFETDQWPITVKIPNADRLFFRSTNVFSLISCLQFGQRTVSIRM